MTREFVYTAKFDGKWRGLGLNDDDLGLLEDFVLRNPKAGRVMEGTGGIRKLRWALPGKGKSGGARVLYVDFIAAEKVCMFDLFLKDDKENLTHAERRALKQIVKAIGKEFAK